MAWELDDTKTATITINALEGKAKLGNISFPPTASPGQTITVSVPVTNSGGSGADTLMVELHVKDPDTNTPVLTPVENNVGVVQMNETVTAIFNVTIPANWVKNSINLFAEGYHLEGF